MKQFLLNMWWLVSRAVLLCLGLVLIVVCLLLAVPFLSGTWRSLAGSDEAILRREFSIPKAAVASGYTAYPKEAGWFGREGLGINIQFTMAEATFAEYLARIKEQAGWQPLPISEEFILRMGSIRWYQKYYDDLYAKRFKETGEPIPELGSAYYLSLEQRREQFVKSLPLGAKNGFYLCKYAGNDIMHFPKKIALDDGGDDLPDLMLGVVDTDARTVRVRVKAPY